MGPVEPSPRLLQTFLDLVRIDSPSRDEAACARYCEAALLEAGCSIRYDESAAVTGSECGNLIAELPGTAPGTLVLSAHLDTVEPGRGIDPVISDGLIVAAGDTILGADDKVGLASAIECARRLAESQGDHPTVRCVFTVQEEVGLRGAKALDPKAVEGDLCLVLDADGDPGGVVIGAPTHYTFTATFKGRAAHAGVSPEKGVSAISMAAEAIAAMPSGRLDERTTANIGTINGGVATNVVAGSAIVTGECRSRDRDTVEDVKGRMESAMRSAAMKRGGSVDIEWNLEYESFELSDHDPMVELVLASAAELGLRPHTFVTGGGSDANVIAAHGVPTVALACGMKGVHSTDEQLETEDLESLTRLCEAVARNMAHLRGEGA